MIHGNKKKKQNQSTCYCARLPYIFRMALLIQVHSFFLWLYSSMNERGQKAITIWCTSKMDGAKITLTKRGVQNTYNYVPFSDIFVPQTRKKIKDIFKKKHTTHKFLLTFSKFWLFTSWKHYSMHTNSKAHFVHWIYDL